MIETRRLKNVVIFAQTILSFVLSRKIINSLLYVSLFITQIFSIFLQFSIKLEEWERNNSQFFGEKIGLSAIFYKKDLNWQRQFLNFLESFIIKFL